ncbi:MAG TPA: hypothetical protein VK988_10720 [Acidimicrobiales bacterium]|nr:hypothetical protein [Actinomycetota bacterium]HSH60095.1 hypothetical protein [Acidimicrobiales bacterium]
MDEPFIAHSARRHGVRDAVIFHAFMHPILVEQLDDALTMLVGPDPAGNLYEIGVVTSEDGPVIVHAMPARSRYLR